MILSKKLEASDDSINLCILFGKVVLKLDVLPVIFFFFFFLRQISYSFVATISMSQHNFYETHEFHRL